MFFIMLLVIRPRGGLELVDAFGLGLLGSHHPLPLEDDLSSDQEGSSKPTTIEAWFH